MALIRDFLINKQFYVSVDNVDERLKQETIETSSVIQSLIFDKEIYKNEQEPRVWAIEHGFSSDNTSDNSKNYKVIQYDVSEFVNGTLKEIEIITGITAVVGILKQDAMNEVSFLSLRNHDKTIKLDSSLPHIIEIAKVVKGYHAAYGEIEITKKMLIQFEENFKNKILGVDISIDFDHDRGKAAGWLKDVFRSHDGKVLFGEVIWTPKGSQALSDKDFRYFSPEFTNNYIHPHTGKQHGATIIGGGLVNRPFLKMDAIVSLKEKILEGEPMDTIKLSEHKSVVEGLEKEILNFKLSEEKTKTIVASMKEENVKLSEENKNLSEKINELENEKAKAELIAKNTKLFDEGKINAVQLSALNEGKDLYEVLSLSVGVVKTEGKGIIGKDEDNVQLSEADLKAIKAMNISKEDYIKYNNLGGK